VGTFIINLLAAVAALGASFVAMVMAPLPPGNADYSFGYRMGSFSGALFLIVIIPWLISFAFKKPSRPRALGVGVIILSGLLTLGKIQQWSKSPQRVLAEAQQMSDQMKAQARQSMAANGDIDGEAQTHQALQNMQKLQNELDDGSVTSRVARDILKVGTDLVKKVQASNEIEKTCDFSLNDVKGADDLTARIALTGKLHDAASDVLSFLQNFDQHCRDAMAPDNFPDATQRGAIDGARTSGHIDMVISLWQAKVGLCDDFTASYGLLAKHWGEWEAKDDHPVFKDAALDAEYESLMTSLRAHLKTLEDTQKALVQ
jgi:outer membrane murein-binding lipoprotein Lpp